MTPHPQKMEVPTWQPIETAPRDAHRIILGFAPDEEDFSPDTREGFWHEGLQRWSSSLDPNWTTSPQPTHWMPLPAAPGSALRSAVEGQEAVRAVRAVEARSLPELPEALVVVRDTDEELEGGGWIVDCDCEGPLSYSLDAGEALYTADQMRAYAEAAIAATPAPSAEARQGGKSDV